MSVWILFFSFRLLSVTTISSCLNFWFFSFSMVSFFNLTVSCAYVVHIKNEDINQLNHKSYPLYHGIHGTNNNFVNAVSISGKTGKHKYAYIVSRALFVCFCNMPNTTTFAFTEQVTLYVKCWPFQRNHSTLPLYKSRLHSSLKYIHWRILWFIFHRLTIFYHWTP